MPDRRRTADRSRSPRGSKGPKAILNVQNLTRNVNEAHLEEIFGIFGKVRSVNLGIDKVVKLPKGYAYVEYATKEEADKAVDHMHGAQIDGMVIKVDFARLQTSSSDRKKDDDRRRREEERKREDERKKRRNRSPSSSSSSSSAPRDRRRR